MRVRGARSIGRGIVIALCLSAIDCAPKEAGESCEEHKSQCAKGLECDSGVCRPCAQSQSCLASGRCAFFADQCVVTAAGCQDSTGCKNDGLCTVHEGACVKKVPIVSSGDEKEGGCPCGCDRSEAMVDTLEGVDAEDALREARRSLAVIAEREHAGYITEAMVTHRLALRTLERARAPEGDVFLAAISPPARALRDARSALPIETSGSIALREELVVYGATVDIVDGKPKALLPCFRLWLALENPTDEPRVLARPTLRGNVHFDVRRWYVEGTDGEAWRGSLGPRERRSVMVIGYVEEAIAPGHAIDATFSFGEASFAVRTTALGRWDARL